MPAPTTPAKRRLISKTGPASSTPKQAAAMSASLVEVLHRCRAEEKKKARVSTSTGVATAVPMSTEAQKVPTALPKSTESAAGPSSTESEEVAIAEAVGMDLALPMSTTSQGMALALPMSTASQGIATAGPKSTQSAGVALALPMSAASVPTGEAHVALPKSTQSSCAGPMSTASQGVPTAQPKSTRSRKKGARVVPTSPPGDTLMLEGQEHDDLQERQVPGLKT